jgi:signal transduction histidine kinase
VVAAAERVSEITKGMELGHRRRDEESTADLKEIVELTLTFVRAALLKQAHLKVELESVPHVKGSPTKLGQVMTNLLVNAMQAMPDRVRTENIIFVSLKKSDEPGWVELEVKDNGDGIPEDVVENIFDPFFTTKAQGGTGLGLAISRKIVEESDGRIEVSSESGIGTTFRVLLQEVV